MDVYTYVCSKYILNLLPGLWVLVYLLSLDLGVEVVKGAASAAGVTEGWPSFLGLVVTIK